LSGLRLLPEQPGQRQGQYTIAHGTGLNDQAAFFIAQI